MPYAMAAMACLRCPALPASFSSSSRPCSSRPHSPAASSIVTSCSVGSSQVHLSRERKFPGFNRSYGHDKTIGKLESLFYTDSGIPEEKIERPTGLPKGSRAIGTKPRCPACNAKGAVECATCAGSGLYVDAVLESQGIIVKVRCLGCGSAGNHMCLKCGGRGHL